MKNKSLLKRVVIYPRSEVQKQHWEKEANKRVISLSKFLLCIIEESLEAPKVKERQAITDAKLETIEAAQENKTLKQEILRLNKLLSIQEKELVDLRNKAFLEPTFSGVRSFDKTLLTLLQSKNKAFNQDEIMAAMNIVYTDSEAIKSLTAQLDALIEYKLITVTGRGWKWMM
ncbi:MAG: hypothetical protein Q7J68_08035 [Thermoplasmata archaeon]|nr:hypothetical protein [Thermoplasmata archaeon]